MIDKLNNQQKKMAKKLKLSISKKQVDRAGKTLKQDPNDTEAKENVREFRACHNYPLVAINNLVSNRIKKLELKDATVAQRLKRLPTIINKLTRASLDGKSDNTMKLSQMDDIGGCRVILKNIKDVQSLKNSLEKNSASHEIRIKDYIDRPKRSGYRSVHFIFNCYKNKDNHESRGLKVELQIRTKIQHAWATAVEMVDIFERTDLKTNVFTESEDWKRFFYVTSRLLSIMEGTHKPCDKDKLLLMEWDKLEANLNACSKINDFKTLITLTQHKKERFKKHTLYLLVRNDDDTMSGHYVSLDNFSDAERKYNEYEEDPRVVYTALVGTDSFQSFKKAYPNFSADARYFVVLLEKLKEWGN